MAKPHTYGKATLKRMSPLQRRVAEEVNHLERTAARLRRVVEQLGNVEEDAAAQRKEREELAAFVAENLLDGDTNLCVAHGRQGYTPEGFVVCSAGLDSELAGALQTAGS